jgi:homoserine dehydrogenase
MSVQPRPLASGVCRVGIAGFGTVGRAVARLMRDVAPAELRLVAVCNRRVERKRTDVLGDVRWTDRIEDLVDADLDVIVELIGGRTPAEEWIRRALDAGKSVVTANKQVIAHAGPELLDRARRAGRHLRFEAAVGGGIPVLRAIEDGLCGDRLSRVAGVLNGTCNYVLTRLEQDHRLAFNDALREAQALGLAEANPADDIEGFDARAKLAILALVALGLRVRPEEISCRSIAAVEPIDFVYARRLGATIRQVAWVERAPHGSGQTVAVVRPALVPAASPLAHATGSDNVVIVNGEFGGETAFSGHGAGGDPTAVAVVSDLLTIARSAAPPRALRAAASAVSSELVAPQYVRFTVADRPGIIAELAAVFARHDISIDAVLQEPGCPAERLPFVMSLEPCAPSGVDRALAAAASLDFHVAPPLAMPILAAATVGARAAAPAPAWVGHASS